MNNFTKGLNSYCYDKFHEVVYKIKVESLARNLQLDLFEMVMIQSSVILNKLKMYEIDYKKY